jgi:hypothetical protein
MTTINPLKPAAAALLALLVTEAGAGASASPYEPLAFLVGHCWKGAFAGGSTTDEHCFSWIYGGKFVRDEHVVRHGNGQPDGFGESIYVWDAPTRQLEYLYIESAGGYSRGTVSADGDALVFPPTSYLENGERQTYRSRWQRSGGDAYDVVTEFQAKDRWVAGFTLHMQLENPPALAPKP